MSQSAALELPSRYSLREQIGEGGMSRVYLGLDHGGDGVTRQVVIKRLRDHLSCDVDAVRRFRNEAELHARVRHPNVVGIHDIGQDERGYFIALEWIDGASLHVLAQRAQRQRVHFGIRVATRIVLDALRGLHAAHEACDELGHPLGILHRDATPSNILVGRDGRSCLTDFGVAKAKSGRRLTDPGMVVGKLDYLSPEYLSRRPVGVTMDVYAMGVTAWVALTGRRPFGDTAGMSADMLTRRVPELPESSGVPRGVAAVVHRACSHDPADRYPTAKAMAIALETAARADDALATHAEVAETVRTILNPVAARPASIPPGASSAPKAWEQRGVPEETWRNEEPTRRDLTRGHSLVT